MLLWMFKSSFLYYIPSAPAFNSGLQWCVGSSNWALEMKDCRWCFDHQNRGFWSSCIGLASWACNSCLRQLLQDVRLSPNMFSLAKFQEKTQDSKTSMCFLRWALFLSSLSLPQCFSQKAKSSCHALNSREAKGFNRIGSKRFLAVGGRSTCDFSFW